MKKKIKYTNGELTVVWQPDLCWHSGNCMAGLPEVFKAADRPWVQMENSTTERIAEQVRMCPSGALSFYYNDEGEGEE